MFGTPEENPYNTCFCADGNCAPSGLFNISSCQFGYLHTTIYTVSTHYLHPRSPLMMSWPHFYQADPRLLRDVEGLQPDRDKHQFQLDILPVRRRGSDEDGEKD